MMTKTHAALLVAVMAIVTILLRAFPFLVLRGRQTPRYITYLGRVLPFSIIGMLVVYCLKEVKLLQVPHGLPELLAVAVTAGLHVWKRNTLLSILGGTLCYMLLVQVVFTSFP